MASLLFKESQCASLTAAQAIIPQAAKLISSATRSMVPREVAQSRWMTGAPPADRSFMRSKPLGDRDHVGLLRIVAPLSERSWPRLRSPDAASSRSACLVRDGWQHRRRHQHSRLTHSRDTKGRFVMRTIAAACHLPLQARRAAAMTRRQPLKGRPSTSILIAVLDYLPLPASPPTRSARES